MLKLKQGFTIVELLVVIVVIGILATVTMVSYGGITKKANETALLSDLNGGTKQFELYKAENDSYPTSVNSNNCPFSPKQDLDKCLKPYIKTKDLSSTGFTLTAQNNNVSGIVTNSTPAVIVAALPSVTSYSFSVNGVGRSGTIQTWIVPATGTYKIEAWGAQGGGGQTLAGGGLGAYIKGNISLTVGSTIKILVGQTPIWENGAEYYIYDGWGGGSGGGGGGSFITKNDNTPLIIAGGGGGYLDSQISSELSINGQSGQSGANSFDNTGNGGNGGNGGSGSDSGWGGGGGGLLSDGGNSIQCGNTTGGASFVSGGIGGSYCNDNGWSAFASGGFGGGGGTHGSTGGGGGGGGYSGGGGSNQDMNPNFGGGGGSFNAGLAGSQVNVSGLNTGDGKVLITFLP